MCAHESSLLQATAVPPAQAGGSRTLPAGAWEAEHYKAKATHAEAEGARLHPTPVSGSAPDADHRGDEPRLGMLLPHTCAGAAIILGALLPSQPRTMTPAARTLAPSSPRPSATPTLPGQASPKGRAQGREASGGEQGPGQAGPSRTRQLGAEKAALRSRR